MINMIRTTRKDDVAILISKKFLLNILDMMGNDDIVTVNNISDWTGVESEKLDGRKLDESFIDNLGIAVVYNNIKVAATYKNDNKYI